MTTVNPESQQDVNDFDQMGYFNSKMEKGKIQSDDSVDEQKDSVIYLGTELTKEQSDEAIEDLSKGHAENFEASLNRIKEFSNSLPEDNVLPTMKTSDGLFGLFDHTVTGTEINGLTAKIQQKMIDQNTIIVNVIKEFRGVYQTFEDLDKDYIQKILISLKAAQIANDNAKEGLKKIEKQQDDIFASQNDISNLIKQQDKMIRVLTKFNDELQNLNHLQEIDDIYTANQQMKVEIENLKESKDTLSNKIEQLDNLQDEHQRIGGVLESVVDEVEDFKNKSAELVAKVDKQAEQLSSNADEMQQYENNVEEQMHQLKDAVEVDNQLINAKIEKMNRVVVILSLVTGILLFAVLWLSLKG
ncbi:hypothetical protein [Weissella confusa]|uniref:hypothetical protein n=1 Tax=Weissella confusa TaxID=1583 RepID=UPI0022FF0E00|nr:hypothetical protein [Weissella confusa]MDA5457423.1 hypothetical protein [Weissella confusa]